MDRAIAQSVFRRTATVSVARVKLAPDVDVKALNQRLAADPRLSGTLIPEQEFFAGQSASRVALIDAFAYLIAGIMALGSVFGALATMFTAVSRRAVEIPTLRALGFPRRSGRHLGSGRGDGAGARRGDPGRRRRVRGSGRLYRIDAQPGRRVPVGLCVPGDAGVDTARPRVGHRPWRHRRHGAGDACRAFADHDRSAGDLSVPGADHHDSTTTDIIGAIRGVRGGSHRLRVRPLVPMGFHERPHGVRTILVWILRDHLGQMRTGTGILTRVVSSGPRGIRDGHLHRRARAGRAERSGAGQARAGHAGAHPPGRALSGALPVRLANAICGVPDPGNKIRNDGTHTTAGVRRRRPHRMDRRRAAAAAPARTATVDIRPAAGTPGRTAGRAATADRNAVGRAPRCSGRTPVRDPRPAGAGMDARRRTVPRNRLDRREHARGTPRGDRLRTGSVHPARGAARPEKPGRTGRRTPCLGPWIAAAS